MQAAGVPVPEEAELYSAVVRAYTELGRPAEAGKVAASWHHLAASLRPGALSELPAGASQAGPEAEAEVKEV